MKTSQIREKFIKFFVARGHKKITAAPLVLENDPSTLFTSSGMQPLVPYLKGKKHPKGKRLVNSQPCLRIEDIDQVGDSRRTTYFEMLGNWSLGDYFKKEQLAWFWEFLVKELGLPKERLFVTVFQGNGQVSKDNESVEIYTKLGISKDRIFYYGVEHNWWSRTGLPNQMPPGEIGGPDSEVFYDFGKELKLHENSSYRKQKCHPNCECGRFLEIGNSVFIEYVKEKGGGLNKLLQKAVDFGGGLERLAAAEANEPDIFRVDVFGRVIKNIEKELGVSYNWFQNQEPRTRRKASKRAWKASFETGSYYNESGDKRRHIRIIADHTRAAYALLAEGVLPGNKMQGYVLRRLIRRAAFHSRILGVKLADLMGSLADEELRRFNQTLDRGLRKLKEAISTGKRINGKLAFSLYQNHGFPLELTLEILTESGLEFSQKDKKAFAEEFEKHQKLSRSASSFSLV